MVAGMLRCKVHRVRRVWMKVMGCGRCAGRLWRYSHSKAMALIKWS